jgi:cytoskeletal protein CcmA (bactofilin family)
MRRRLAAVLPSVVIGTALLAGPARAQEATPIPARDQVVLSGTVLVGRGTAVGEVLVFSGRVIVNGVVEGDVVVFEGPIVVAGQVNGSVIAADGLVTLRESARVGGDVSASGRVARAEGAEVRGGVREGVRFSLEAPLAGLGELLGPIAVAVSVLLLGLLLLWVAPRGADAVADALGSAPLASVGWGIVVTIAAPILAVALCVLVVGLPLGLALLFSMGLWWIGGLGLAAWSLGRALVRPPKGRVLALLAGWAILAAVGLVPVLNAAVWILGSVIGLGATAVAVSRARHGGRHIGRHRRSPSGDRSSIEAGIA